MVLCGKIFQGAKYEAVLQVAVGDEMLGVLFHGLPDITVPLVLNYFALLSEISHKSCL